MITTLFPIFCITLFDKVPFYLSCALICINLMIRDKHILQNFIILKLLGYDYYISLTIYAILYAIPKLNSMFSKNPIVWE